MLCNLVQLANKCVLLFRFYRVLEAPHYNMTRVWSKHRIKLYLLCGFLIFCFESAWLYVIKHILL